MLKNFLPSLKNIVDPEKKKNNWKLFIKIFEKSQKKLKM